jgi:hypothetical protein
MNLFVQMPEPDDMDSVRMSSATQFNGSQETVAMEIEVHGEGEKPSQEPGERQGSEQVVIDLEEEKGPARKQMEPRSEMWQYFIKIKDDKGCLIAGKCKFCQRQLKADTSRHGTSALKKHFNICKRNPHVFNKDPKQGTLQATQGEAPTTWRFDQDALREAFAEMIIEDELPFAFGEKPGFRKFMSKACPRFQLPSRRTCTRDIVRHYFEEKAKLKKFFKDSCQRVCLATDCWTSQVQDGYMTVTVSF